VTRVYGIQIGMVVANQEEFDRYINSLVKSEKLGLMVDIDGTISPIAPAPAVASVSPRCHEALSVLSERLPLTAIVTGRDIHDARRMIDLPRLIYIGNHGLEEWRDGQSIILPQAARFAHRIPDALRRVESQVHIDGMIFENKGVTASIHYRLTPDPIAARNQVMTALEPLADIFDLKVTEGEMVIEIKPPIDYDKGDAVERLANTHNLTGVIFLGDDKPDVGAFQAVRRMRESGLPGLAIVVTRDETPEEVTSEADWKLNTVRGTEDFLFNLLDVYKI